MPPGFNALETKAWVAEGNEKAVPSLKNGTAPCFGHQLQRSGCFPALPYPPNWWAYTITGANKFKPKEILLVFYLKRSSFFCKA